MHMFTVSTYICKMITISEFEPELKEHFARLNYHWIQKYFWTEDADTYYLENPESAIIAKGGDIFFAKLNDEVVGTCALIKHSNEVYELSKMAVDEKAQGQHVGYQLAIAVIAKAKKLNAKTLYLDSNTKLVAAINLYRKLGFVEQPDYVSSYARSNIHMEMNLNSN